MSLTAYQVLEHIGRLYEESSDNWRQALVLNGMGSHILELDYHKNGKIGRELERFEFVNYDDHPLLTLKIQDDMDVVEQGDPFGTLHRLVDRTNSWNIFHKVHDIPDHLQFPVGEVVKFWGKDGEFYVMPITTNLWHTQHVQESVLYKRVKFAEVNMYDPENPDHGPLIPFIGTQEDCIAFAKKLDPMLHEMTRNELMGNQGAMPMPDGSTPRIGEVGKLLVIVHGHTFE